MKNPLIVYVDDEPRNLSLFEVLLGEKYELKLFSNAVDALKSIKEFQPEVIVTDQRMPGMTGLEFLEIAGQILPDIPRVIITGQTDEETMVKLVRRTQLFDYITKPVSEDDLLVSMDRAVAYSSNRRALQKALEETKRLNIELTQKTQELQSQNEKLKSSSEREIRLRREAEAWSSIEIVSAMHEKSIQFPIKSDLTCITYDIVGSSKLHGLKIDGKDLRGEVLNLFTSCLLKFGATQECHGGDAAFGHFGAISKEPDQAARALAVAQEFRVGLRQISQIYNVKVECGIAIHLALNAIVNVHEVHANRSGETVVKKFLSSASPEIDSMFRLEKLSHQLPGTNILLTEPIVKSIPQIPKIKHLGHWNGHPPMQETPIHIIPSDLLTPEDMAEFISKYFSAAMKAAA